MSDTYNENEIVRCKHLNEFARQLRIKLDGGTDPKIDRPNIRFRASKAYVDGETVSNYNITDITEFTIDLTSLSARNNGDKGFQIDFNGTKDPIPYPIRFAIDGENTYMYGSTWASPESVNVAYSNSFATTNVSKTTSITLCISETNIYKAIERTWIIHFINGGE